MIYAPYDRKEKTLFYYIYRCLNLLKLPFSSFFWGAWKDKLSNVEKVIIFDYGYQNCMEKYIKKINPHCEVNLFCWNKIDRYHKSGLKFTDKTRIYSTDPGDCEKYGFKYNHIFYPSELHEDWNPELSDRVYFIGADKGRASSLLSLKSLFEQCGLKTDISVISSNCNPDYLNQFSSILSDKPITYSQYISEIKKNGILLDICQKDQRAITMRVLESVVYSKKLITTNPEVKNFSFYKPENILIIDLTNLPGPEDLRDFISKSFIPYSREELDEIGTEHWLKGF